MGALIFYTHFYKLDSLPYRMWDEARLANNAYEMAQSGNLLITTINHDADMWNTKPPLMYLYQLNERGMNIQIMSADDFSKIKAGDKVLTDDEGTQRAIESGYNFRVLKSTGNIRLYKLISPKSTTCNSFIEKRVNGNSPFLHLHALKRVIGSQVRPV